MTENNWFEKNPKKTWFFFYIFILLCVEGILQIHQTLSTQRPAFEPIPYKNNPKTYFDFVPNLKYKRFLYKYDGNRVIFNSINRLGIRGPEIKDKKAYRVLNVGDSFVEADEVLFEQTFSEKLNYYFNGKIEFIAHGISRWAPTTEFAWIYHKGLLLKPNEINLFVCLNDFYRSKAETYTDQSYRQKAKYQGGIPIQFPSQGENTPLLSVDHSFKSWLIRNVKSIGYFYYTIYKPLKEKWKNYFIQQPSEIVLLSKDISEWPQDLKENVDETVQVLKNIHDFLKAKKIKLNILMVPFPYAWPDENLMGKKDYGWPKEFTISQKGIESYLESTLTKANINYLPLRNDFEQEKKLHPEMKLFLPEDGHWNEKGHEIIYEVLKKYYETKIN